MLKTPVGRLRALGMVEAVSFLLLLSVAMPLKYFAGLPLAVKIAGWLHGLLFWLSVWFCCKPSKRKTGPFGGPP